MIKNLLFFFFGFVAIAQHSTNMVITLNPDKDMLNIKQELLIHNQSNQEWNEVVLLDWANAFSSQESALAARFAEDFKNRFEFSSQSRRGGTAITPNDYDSQGIELIRDEHAVDVLRMKLDKPLLPNQKRKVAIHYQVKIPDAAFTDYGKKNDGTYSVKYWYLHPAQFIDGQWTYYSHKMLNDFYGSPMDFVVSLHLPDTYQAVSSISTSLSSKVKGKRSYLFEGKLLKEARLNIFQEQSLFTEYNVPGADVITDIRESNLNFESKLIFLSRITSFLNDRLGSLRESRLFVSEDYYKENPVYGLSELPSFINPYPAGFTYEVKMLKTMTRKWVENGINVNPREDGWMQQSIMVYLLMEYINLYYPDLKISGALGEIWGIRSFDLAKLKINDQYPLIYLNSARLNLDQAVNTPIDSLIKINEQLAIPYKGAIGLRYLNDYIGSDALERSLREIYSTTDRSTVNPEVFQKNLQAKTDLPINWFFDDFITTHKRIDWKVKRLKKGDDSIQLTIKNKSDLKIPVPVYTLNNDSIITKKYIPGFVGDSTITLSRKQANRLAINYERIIPEFNPRDNYRTLKSFPALNRPVEFRFFKDVEDPERSQVFFIPDFEFNIYDGIALGSRFYNNNILSKPFKYSLKPAYGFRSNKIVGSLSFRHDHPLQDRNESLFQITYGANVSRFSYEDDLMFRRASGFLSFNYRPKDLRSNRRQRLTFRNVFIDRDRNPDTPIDEPDYNVFAINFTDADPNFRRFFLYNVGAEISPKFSKATFRIEWRKLFKDNRQLNVRFFAGAFLHNDSQREGDFFSFALDRPTDYLFDYNYYGRSEDEGLFSQQLIIAEGGFKSQLEPAFANQWITTVNTSYSIWKYVFAYGDVGLVNNRDSSPKFVYDSGIRLNLLQDYFELYFPIYSNNGWEIAQDDYDQRIRFIVSLDLSTFIRLFQRRWY